MTGGTNGDLPQVTGKPGEFGGWFAQGGGAWSQAKTANLEGNARWIEKGVGVAVIDRDALPMVSDLGTASGAEDDLVVLFLGRLPRLRARWAERLRGG